MKRGNTMNLISQLNENELKALRHDIEPLFLNNPFPRSDLVGVMPGVGAMTDDSKSVSVFSKKTPLQFLKFLFSSGESNQLQTGTREENIEKLEQHALNAYTELAISTVENSSVYEKLSSIVNDYMEEDLGEVVWRKLEEKSRKFIMTAEVLSDFLYMFDNQLDYASPTLNYCKAVENELNEKFVGPFKKYYISQNKRLKKDDYASKLAIIISRPNANLTLG